MNQKHLLLKRAFIYSITPKSKEPDNCHYDMVLGGWIFDNEFLVKSQNPERPKPQTKKGDLETGEDQKGE